jgi:Ca2+:H+ antiporter
MGLFSRVAPRNGPSRNSKTSRTSADAGAASDIEMRSPSKSKAKTDSDTNTFPSSDFHDTSSQQILPTAGHILNHNGHKVTPGIQPEGESGRKGIHPFHFLRICWRSTSHASKVVNVLWPVVPAAIALRYSKPDLHLWIFILNYVAMIPCANLIGFAGQELARKLHKVFGILLETTLGSVVEIVMFMVLVSQDKFTIIQDAILGSILATQLLCLGTCFAVGGIHHDEQEFDEVVGEVGSDLLLTA